ncbi:CDP-alcohol phosphatidyltransferase family protein [Georgenia yuyongxinii]|uniref:CDP-alcohol phosphatidyltransferase family protein n=1 Tax=Georgenia yuyongxinii TaxID=2589797 RepID=A0A5B8CAW9_9MICO|nr:CDP-alcohol phosphatidyltransferase family protein [Georgenia yuyongxinii]QDC26605.1 CDP-alcohol phosphatidyltransferase family protein [Georgenia yuyongxinii]
MQTGDEPAPPTASERVLTLPNAISFARLLLVPVFGVLIFTERDVAALVVLVVAGASDWFDGVIARRFNQMSRLGQLLDPAADRLYIFVTLVGLAWRELVPWWLVVVIALRDVLLAALLPVLTRHGYGPLPVHLAGKAGTFALMYAFPLLLLANVPGTFGTVAWTFGWASALWGVGLYWLAAVLYVDQVVRIVRSDQRGARPA